MSDLKKNRPEALAEFAKSAKLAQADTQEKKLEEQADTAALPTDNDDKHDVARELPHTGASGGKHDPKAAGEDVLPDCTRLGQDAKKS